MKIDFNEIKKTLTKAAKKTKETSETVVELAKLKYKLVEINSDIDDKYKAIGRIVYKAGEEDDVTEELKSVCLEIKELSDKKDDMQERYNDLSSKKQCPKCGMKLDKDFEFCPKCGHSFADDE